METKFGFVETVITHGPQSMQVAATLQHTNGKGTESLVISVRLPSGDRSLRELQAEMLARARLLLEAAELPLPPENRSQSEIWQKLAR